MAGKTRPTRQKVQQSDVDARAIERAAALIGKNPLLSKREALRNVGVTEGRDLRRLAGKLAKPAKRAKANSPTRKTPARARATAAAPLLANAPKKVGAVGRAERAAGAPSRASYQPKTDVPPHQGSLPMRPPAALDVMAMAQPWMTLGWRMTAAGFALQASAAKAAMEMPPAKTAMRQSAEVFKAWLNLFQQPHAPKTKKD